MSTPFQNRLVGTIIVAAAIVIFLPDILDGKKESNQAEFEPIPTEQTFTGKISKKTFPESDLVKKESPIVFNEEPKDSLLVKNDSQVDKINTNQGNAKVTPAIKPNKITKNPTEKPTKTSDTNKLALGKEPFKAVNKEAWVIQLGSFKHKSNVAELVSKLKQNGYTVFTKPIQTKKGTLTKVIVGPELIKSSLIKKLPDLKKLTNVQGKIARFYPTK